MKIEKKYIKHSWRDHPQESQGPSLQAISSNVRLIRPSVERRRRHSEHREVPHTTPAEAVSRASPPFTHVPRTKVLCSLAQQPALCHP